MMDSGVMAQINEELEADGWTNPLDGPHSFGEQRDDGLDRIGDDITRLRGMLDEYKAIVERDEAQMELRFIHGDGSSVPVGILGLPASIPAGSAPESDRRVVLRWLARVALSTACLLAMAWLAVNTNLTYWYEVLVFFQLWLTSTKLERHAYYTGGTIMRIARAKMRRGLT